MPQPKVLILRAPGTNCDEEAVHAFRLAGGLPERVHVNEILANPAQLSANQILCLPGGFSYGDDIAAGQILAIQIRQRLADTLCKFRDAGNLILGICNGFQVLIKSGLLLPDDNAGPVATLAANDSGHFEDRWVRLAPSGNKCVFLSEIREMDLPIAHGEGKFVTRDQGKFDALEKAGQLVLRYQSPSPNRQSPLPYPDNPNGSMGDVAGVCDATGRVFGLMPHPERHVHFTHHPRWTRHSHRGEGDGLRVFQNAVRYFS
jgi:phosphoribosylformylglycinamidine synthase